MMRETVPVVTQAVRTNKPSGKDTFLRKFDAGELIATSPCANSLLKLSQFVAIHVFPFVIDTFKDLTFEVDTWFRGNFAATQNFKKLCFEQRCSVQRNQKIEWKKAFTLLPLRDVTSVSFNHTPHILIFCDRDYNHSGG